MACIMFLLLHLIFPIQIWAKEYTQEDLFTMELQELLEIEIVTATKTKKKVQNVPATVTLITADQIRNMGARNIMDVLRMVPGINIGRNDYGIWEGIEVRGIRTTFSEKVLLLQDGHTLNSPQDGSSSRLFDDLVINNIKQVEVIRGPLSAMYGNNAFVAIVNIITKKAKDIDGLEVKAGGGSFDTQQYNVLFGHQIEKFGITGYFDYFDTNGANLHIEEDVLSPAPFSDAPGHTDDWKEKKDLNLNLSYGDFTLWGKYLERKRGSTIGAAYALNDESVAIHRQYYSQLEFNHSFEIDLDVFARLYFDHFDGDFYWELFPEGFPGYPEGMIGHPKIKTDTYGGEMKVDYETFKTNITTFGILYEKMKLYEAISYANFHPITFAPLAGGYQDISDWGNYISEDDRDIFAFYLQNDLDLLDKYGFNILFGGRYDHYSDFGEAFSPRTGLIWRIIPELDLKALYGHAFRAPSFSELYQKNNPSIKGNPDLDAEKSWTAEAGLVYRITPQINLELTYFHTEIEDLIQVKSMEFVNSGGIITEGVETELKVNFGEGYYGFANYTYQIPREFGESVVPDVPKHLANVGVNLHPWKYLNSNTTIHYTGPRPRREGDGRDDLGGYTVVNQTFIVKNFFETLEIRGSIYNLFDEDYQDPAPMQTLEYDFPQPGRNYFFEVAYTF